MSTDHRATTQHDLTIAGYVLAVFVVIDVAMWLWGTTFPGDMALLALSFVGGALLFLGWLAYLAIWAFAVRRFAWQLLIIPLIGGLAIGLRFAGAVPDARWGYDEPRLRAAAERMLADPRPEVDDYEARSIGTQEVYSASKRDGVVRFHIAGPSISTTQLAYHPVGATPADATRTRITHLSGRWWLELSD